MVFSHCQDLRAAVFSAKEQGKQTPLLPPPESMFCRLLETVAHILKCGFSLKNRL